MNITKKDIVIDGKIQLEDDNYGIIKVNGKAKSDNDINADEISVNGKLDVKGNICVVSKFLISGKCKVVKLQADHIFIKGRIDANNVCAKKIVINMGSSCSINEMYGDQIIVDYRELNEIETKIGNFILNIFGKDDKYDEIISSSHLKCTKIKGKHIELTNVIADEVVGETVHIGDNCKIKVLKYSNEVNVSSNGVVESIIRI